MIEAVLLGFAAYLLVGLIFAIPFAIVGVRRIDPHAAHGSWGFRVMIVPGATLLWPLLAKRWISGAQQPPEQNDAHRRAASSADFQSAVSQACSLRAVATSSAREDDNTPSATRRYSRLPVCATELSL